MQIFHSCCIYPTYKEVSRKIRKLAHPAYTDHVAVNASMTIGEKKVAFLLFLLTVRGNRPYFCESDCSLSEHLADFK